MTSPQTVFNAKTPEKQAEISWRFMNLYKSNVRGRGCGDKVGVKFDYEKNKIVFEKGSLYWAWGAITINEWLSHLRGEKMLGLGPVLDDGMVWWACIDIDQVDGDKRYKFDGIEIVKKIALRGLPLVADWSKSGGLHLKIFFSEPVEAELARRALTKWCAQLGLSGNEIFPKQTKLASADDCPSWLFMPYGPVWEHEGHFMAEQSGIGANGGLLDIEEYLALCDRSKVTRTMLVEHTKDFIDNAGRTSSPRDQKRSTGRWGQMATDTDTVKETFKDGPFCLATIARVGSVTYQHNFLIACATFFKRKYPDNWDEALVWVNYNILRPSGDATKLDDLVKSVGHRDYEYKCKDAPIESHCDARICRLQKYGVGTGKGDMEKLELGLTIMKREPTLVFVSIGDQRFCVESDDLLDIKRFRKKSFQYTLAFPNMLKQFEWDEIIRRNVESAVEIEPPPFMSSHAAEIEQLTTYFRHYIPHWIRTRGEEYKNGQVGDDVRIRMDRQRIYFKWDKLSFWLGRAFNMKKRELEDFRRFLYGIVDVHDRNDSLGGFYRSSYSLPFNVIASMDDWLHPDDMEEAKEE